MAAFTRNRRKRKLNPYSVIDHALATFVAAAEAANMIAVTVQLKDEAQKNLAIAGVFDWYLATDAAGLIPAAAASGGVAAGATGKVQQTVAGICGFATTSTAGIVILNITDTTARTVYVVVRHPDGTRSISAAVVFV